MPTDVKVESFSKMQSTAKQLESLSQSYSNIGKQLIQNATTMGSAWEGADNQAYVKKITNITKELEAMSNKILKASQSLNQQTQNYINRQDANVSGAGRLGG